MAIANLPLYVGPGIREWWSTSEHRREYPPDFAEVADEVMARSDTTKAQLGGPEAADALYQAIAAVATTFDLARFACGHHISRAAESQRI